MGVFANSVANGIRERRFQTMLRDYCLQWRNHPTHYVLDAVIAHLRDSNDDNELFETLSNDEFRRLKGERFGTNAVRSDLQRGLEFFSAVRPDLLKFLQLLFLEKRKNTGDLQNLKIHEKYCEDFANFLQLDMPQDRRESIGVHRVLNKIFPIYLDEREDISDFAPRGAAYQRQICVKLINYEIGVWRCKCGELRGRCRRFDYACRCYSVAGTGTLDERIASCSKCKSSASYILCKSCRTRVTLDHVWRMREGRLQPAELHVPLVVTVSIEFPSGVKQNLDITIIDLPLMLGFRERKGELGFELPDIFWIENTSLLDDGVAIVGLADSIRYDRRTELLTVLEAVLRRTLTARGKGQSLKAQFSRMILRHQSFSGRRSLTRGFIRRLCSPYGSITDHPLRPTDLLKLATVPIECAVASSPLLSHQMVFVNRNLTKPGRLSSPFVEVYTAVIKESPLGPDILTPTPLGAAKPRILGDDGIVRVGALLKPGELMVGIESPKSFAHLTSEEKLLRAVFGDVIPHSVDSSLILQGTIPARVLGVNIQLAKRWAGPCIEEGPGKLIRRSPDIELARDELARIAVSLSVDQPVEIGDSIYADDETNGVICRIAGGLTLARFIGSSAEPDLVVSHDHPWARSENGQTGYRYVTVAVRGDTLLGQEAVSRSAGPYSLVTQKPISWDGDSSPAQRLEVEDFLWLLKCGARDLAFELAGPRCDCVKWRTKLFSDTVTGTFQLDNHGVLGVLSGLIQSPSEAIKDLGLTLLSTGVQVSVSRDLPLTLTFSLISENQRLALSHGEVTRPETISSRTFRPVPGGLFCAKIFGPLEDWECLCGKYKSMKHRGVICDNCGVEVTKSSVRRERLGHVSLMLPVVNPFYLKPICEFLSYQYNLLSQDLKDVIYFEKRLVIDSEDASKSPAVTIENNDSQITSRTLHGGVYYYGGDAIKELLNGLYSQTRGETGDWQNAIMRSLIILPPDRRPMVPIGHGRFATSDLNELYKRIITANNRLKKLTELHAPKPIIQSETALLQLTVDQLFDNRNTAEPIRNYNRPLKSLTDSLANFSENRNNLLDGILSKAVDYSARTRLVVGDTIDLDTAIFPERLLWSLLMPMILGEVERKGSANIKTAREETTARTERAYQALVDVCARTVILVRPSFSDWRLIALRPTFSSEMALIVHRQLMDLIGWQNLGKGVRLFGVFSEEAKNEAVKRLLPSALCAAPCQETSSVDHFRKEGSMLSIAKDRVISELAERALSRKSYQLSSYDKLAMCIRE